jgi:hypothetical protein
MEWMVRWSRAFSSLLVVFGVLTSAWATCVESATSAPTEQMACCKAGHDHCPMKDSASDCCKKSGTQVESHGTIVTAVSVSAPMAVPVVWATPPATPSAVYTSSYVSHNSSPPGLLYAPPPYIAFSGLLI